MNYAEIVSSLALVTSILALGWNIVRDLVSDRTAIEFIMAFGEVGNIKNTSTAVFADAGSLDPVHKFDNPGMLIQVTNVGRKSVGISGVGGIYKDGNSIYIAVDGLPKMLQPYEVFSSASNAKEDFMKKVDANKIENLWVLDTAGKRWPISSRGWKRLRKTSSYIVSKKHI